MPVSPSPLAIDLKELLRCALESKIRRADLFIRRAASLAMTAPERDLSDTDRARLGAFIKGEGSDTLTIGGGRELSIAVQDKELDRLITPRHRHLVRLSQFLEPFLTSPP